MGGFGRPSSADGEGPSTIRSLEISLAKVKRLRARARTHDGKGKLVKVRLGISCCTNPAEGVWSEWEKEFLGEVCSLQGLSSAANYDFEKGSFGSAQLIKSADGIRKIGVKTAVRSTCRIRIPSFPV